MPKKPHFFAFGVHVLALVLFWCGFSATLNADEKSYDLKIDTNKSKSVKVATNLTHVGDVIIVKEDSDEKLKFLPLNVEGKLNYFQKQTSASQAVRYFADGNAAIKLEKGKTSPKITEDNRLIIARLKPDSGKTVEYASIGGVLTQPELELLDNPIDPLTVAGLIEKEGVKEGDTWKPDSAKLAKFVNVRKITESNVELVAKKINDRTARLYVKGTLIGDVDDVATKLDVSGIIIVDQKEKTVSSIRVNLVEKREPGQVAPGFEGKQRIDLRFTYGVDCPQLSANSISKATASRSIRQRIRWDSTIGGFTVLYEPRWRMIDSEIEAAILRFVDEGELLAQCNVVNLPARPANKPLTMDQYRDQVEKIVASDKNARLVDSRQFKTNNGDHVICIVVGGKEGGVPVQWQYYHLGCKDGRQATLVFTLESKVAGKVESHFARLIKEFQFNAKPKKVARTPAAPTRK